MGANKLPQRKTNRLQDYDYSQAGYYFITICTDEMKKYFWQNEIVDNKVAEIPLSPTGQMVDKKIKNIPRIYKNVKIDKYIIMPNHIHILVILEGMESGINLSRIIKQFKASASKEAGFSLWQKSFYDRIIRNEHEYLEIWKYIDENPLKWSEDEYCI